MLPHLSPQAWCVVTDSGGTDADLESSSVPRTVDDIRNLLTENDRHNGDADVNGDKSKNPSPQAGNKTLLRVRAGEIVYVLSKKLVS